MGIFLIKTDRNKSCPEIQYRCNWILENCWFKKSFWIQISELRLFEILDSQQISISMISFFSKFEPKQSKTYSKSYCIFKSSDQEILVFGQYATLKGHQFCKKTTKTMKFWSKKYFKSKKLFIDTDWEMFVLFNISIIIW